jgi:hypothetical protein
MCHIIATGAVYAELGALCCERACALVEPLCQNGCGEYQMYLEHRLPLPEGVVAPNDPVLLKTATEKQKLRGRGVASAAERFRRGSASETHRGAAVGRSALAAAAVGGTPGGGGGGGAGGGVGGVSGGESETHGGGGGGGGDGESRENDYHAPGV